MGLIILAAICIAGLFVFYKCYLPLGGRSKQKLWASSHNFRKNIFVNQTPTSMSIKVRDMLSLLREQLRPGTQRQPKPPLLPEPIDVNAFLHAKTPQLLWLGHSTVLLRIGGKTILTDPILSKRSSPFSFIGPKRTISQLPITAEQLPPIDAVVISHDHYDHLDYATIRKLRSKTTKFFVPLGVAAHLRKWGVRQSQIAELDWWDSTEFKGMQLTCTPARHFSGRRIGDRYKTLWASWVIDSHGTKIFLSGDTGYGPHFKQIGEAYGPFDLTLMECGQYNELWSNIHMFPEQTVQAHQDLRGKRLLPIHWGAFVLALHPWADSVQRAEKAARAANVSLLAVKVGEMVPFTATNRANSTWWNI